MIQSGSNILGIVCVLSAVTVMFQKVPVTSTSKKGNNLLAFALDVLGPPRLTPKASQFAEV